MKSNNDFNANNQDNDSDDDDLKKNGNLNRAPVNIFSGQVKEPTVESILTIIDLSLLEKDGLMNPKLNINNL